MEMPSKKQRKLLDRVSSLCKELGRSRPENPYPSAFELKQKFYPKLSKAVVFYKLKSASNQDWLDIVEMKDPRNTLLYKISHAWDKKVKEISQKDNIDGICDVCGQRKKLALFKNKYQCSDCMNSDDDLCLEAIMKQKSTLAFCQEHAFLSKSDIRLIKRKARSRVQR